MSSILDIARVNIAGATSPINVSQVNIGVKVNDQIHVDLITTVKPGDVATSVINVPGVQGPPGLQNVFISTTPPDPRLESNYDVNTKYVWIDIS